MSEHLAKVDPKRVTILLENDHVRVLRVTLESFDQLPAHHHPRGVGVFLTDHDLKNTDGDGRASELRGTRGSAAWFEPTDHVTESLSSRPMEMVFVELKR